MTRPLPLTGNVRERMKQPFPKTLVLPRQGVDKTLPRIGRQALGLLALMMTVSAMAQVGSSGTLDGTAELPSTPVLASSSSASDNSPSRPTMLSSDPNEMSVPLSAAQIGRILQQNPDLIVELKQQVADRLNVSGQVVDANSITDDQLLTQIGSNSALRSGVTSYLRARGYVSQDETQQAETLQSSVSTADRALPSMAGDSRISDEVRSQQAGPGLPLPRRSSSVPQGSQQSGYTHQGKTNASTDQPAVLRRPTPYNLQSLRDLYTQTPTDNLPLKRFGSETFQNRSISDAFGRGVSSGDTPLDVPLGPDYVLGAGDTLTISMWGAVTQSVVRTVGRDGSLLLPEAGQVQLAGLTLGRAQELVASALQRQFRDAKVSLAVSRLRSVRVYITGDVQRPGGYDLSSMATPLSAFYAAGGPTAAGSLRTLHHLRGDRLVENVDLYDFLLHGVRSGSARFESGDTLQVPPAGPLVAISGAVRRPAIYELAPEVSSVASTLGPLLQDAGGLTAEASLEHVTVERVDANEGRSTITPQSNGTLSAAEAAKGFRLQDGDRVRIGTVLPFSERVIYLEGHVARPGRVPFTEGMRLSDVLRSYRDLLPEPAARGELLRLIAPDFHVETQSFDLPSVLVGNGNLSLQPLDTIRILGRYEADAPHVSIVGEVLKPGDYPLSEGLTAAQLVRLAGGFKRSAMRDAADLSSYTVIAGERVQTKLSTIRIGTVLEDRDPSSDVLLKAGDVLTIHELTGFADIGQTITLDGQVRFPGSYGFSEGEHLSALLRRAGGLRDTAYPQGAVLVREQVRELEEKSREELIRQIQTSSAAARVSPSLGGIDAGSQLALVKSQQEEALAQLRSHPPVGRMVINISADISQWENTPADIEVRRGDVLTIPKRPGFVLVNGQVYNPTGITWTPGKTAAWYLAHAGGTNSSANRKDTFVIRANGSVVGRHSGGGWFDGDVLSTKLEPGDVVVVPQKIVGPSFSLRSLLTTAQLASSIAVTAAVAGL